MLHFMHLVECMCVLIHQDTLGVAYYISYRVYVFKYIRIHYVGVTSHTSYRVCVYLH